MVTDRMTHKIAGIKGFQVLGSRGNPLVQRHA